MQQVRPKKGRALLFFPAFVDGSMDRQTLHAALPAEDVKYVCQIWQRQRCVDVASRMPMRGSLGLQLLTALGGHEAQP